MIENFASNQYNIETRERSPSLTHVGSLSKSKSNSFIFTKIEENVVSKITVNCNTDEENEKNSNLEIPTYIQDLFRFYCENIEELWLIKSELSTLSDQLGQYFVCTKKSNDEYDTSHHVMIP